MCATHRQTEVYIEDLKGKLHKECNNFNSKQNVTMFARLIYSSGIYGSIYR